MEQAKWYYIYYHTVENGLPLHLRKSFYYYVLMFQLNDGGIKRLGKPILKAVSLGRGHKPKWVMWLETPVFCGKKKLNMLLREAHLLGLEDELLIFERRN